jgi:hypothetical protein
MLYDFISLTRLALETRLLAKNGFLRPAFFKYRKFGISGFFGVLVRRSRTKTPKKQYFSANPNSRSILNFR